MKLDLLLILKLSVFWGNMKKDQYLNGDSVNSFLRMDKTSEVFSETHVNKKRTIVVSNTLYKFIIENNLSLVEKDYHTIRKLRIIPTSSRCFSTNIYYRDSKKYYLYGDTDILMQFRLEKG